MEKKHAFCIGNQCENLGQLDRLEVTDRLTENINSFFTFG